MAFDQSTRNRLQKFVSDARSLLSEEFTRQLQNDYGLDPHSGAVTPLESLGHLDDTRRETARILRDTLAHYLASSPSAGTSEALDRIVREQAFTVLNRLAALRMAESRGILIESVGNGYQSKGFQLYERLAGPGLGETGDAYRCYLFSIFDEFALDLRVLFDRFSPQGRLFPRETALLDILKLLNDSELAQLWAEDESIGWVYQYFNSKEERKNMRDESAAPRNSRELAVRNQFFTPRYVVEFLTDNALGRIWYEMTKGETGLKESCRYLVRRPVEIFLKAGENAPEQTGGDENLSQEELLKLPVHIPYRPLKDPRTLRMLDPACGSMHFGLYAFDLYEQIYNEAWELELRLDSKAFVREDGLKPLKESYQDKDAFLHDVPRLIIEHNIHGIDIDPRAAQIAGLSLWLRAQRSWHNLAVKPADRPRITRSNIVCAEPMPGEKELLREFTARLEVPAFGYLVEQVFDKMLLAGEAGSLLKIPEEISDIVAEAKRLWKVGPKPTQMGLFSEATLKPEQVELPLDFTGISNERFWESAEEKLYQALKEYAEVAGGHEYQRRLFTEDAARGFAFIDVCRKRYDVVLMNPPFGVPSISSSSFIASVYPKIKTDLYGAFVENALSRLSKFGRIGAITSRTGFFLASFQKWREDIILTESKLDLLLDLGGEVLDAAMVETAAYILEKNNKGSNFKSIFIRLSEYQDKSNALERTFLNLFNNKDVFVKSLKQCSNLPKSPFCYWIPKDVYKIITQCRPFEPDWGKVLVGVQTDDDVRFVLHWMEAPSSKLGGSRSDAISERGWIAYIKGDTTSPYYLDHELVLKWFKDGSELRAATELAPGGRVNNENYYYEPGMSWTGRSDFFTPHVVPEGCIPSVSRYFALPNDSTIDSRFCLVALLSAPIYDFIAKLQMERWKQPKFIPGVIRTLPLPDLKNEIATKLTILGRDAVENTINILCFNETGRLYINPWGRALPKADIKEDYRSYIEFINNQCDILAKTSNLINDEVDKAFGLFNCEVDWLHFMVSESEEDTNKPPIPLEFLRNRFLIDIESFVAGIINWSVGVPLGRWDIRFAIAIKPAPEQQKPFASLPICPPGMFQNEDGLPVEPRDVPSNYPIRITWPGILVDDEGHKEDITGRTCETMEVIWKEKAGDIEHEACAILGVRSLRNYFGKPSGFFADHLKRYTKGRRQTPIYWPLSTPSGSFTLWIYYHRLNDQTLYTCVMDYVEPKLRDVAVELGNLGQKESVRSRDDEKKLEKLQEFEMELQEFRDELLRLARLPWKPNLNDGVQITAAPLWKLFQLPKWKKTLKETWEKLEKGEYDWAHSAYSIWPDRVKKKCMTDKSLAVAHGLEDLYVEPPVSHKKKRCKKVAVLEEDDE